MNSSPNARNQLADLLDKLVRYGAVGVANSAVGLLCIWLAMKLLGLDVARANLLGYGMGFVFSYLLNSKWTFRDRNPGAQSILPFAATQVLAYLCNLSVVLIAHEYFGIDGYVAQALGIPAYFTIGFLGSYLFAFSRPTEKQMERGP